MLPTLGKLAAGETLSSAEMAQLIDAIFDAEVTEEQVALALTAIASRPQSVEEIVGAAQTLRARMTQIASPHDVFVDTCGTGGDHSGTFNISTAAAIVTAAAELPVAKHGNRSFSSKTGSADVLAVLGVNVQAELPVVERCLAELGLCFCFAPLWHRSMKQVAAVRKKLGVPTIFNILGPLANPASAPHQVIGVGRAELRPLLADALRRLGTRRSIVVHGADGLDEVTLTGPTHVSLVTPDEVREFAWTPGDFGLESHSLKDAVVANPEESAAMIQKVLAGEKGTPRDVVILNAAAALWTADRAATPRDAAAQAASAIDSGAAAELLEKLGALSS